MALCNYAFQKVVDKGYSPVCTPDLVKAAVLQRCGFQPRAENTQVDQSICSLPEAALFHESLEVLKRRESLLRPSYLGAVRPLYSGNAGRNVPCRSMQQSMSVCQLVASIAQH